MALFSLSRAYVAVTGDVAWLASPVIQVGAFEDGGGAGPLCAT